MRYIRQIHVVRSIGIGLLALIVVAGGADSSRAQRYVPDPVEDLSQALKLSTLDADRNPDVLTFRERTLRQRIDALHTIGDMRRALVDPKLQWRDVESDAKVADVDSRIRGELLKRFQQAVRNILRQGGRAEQLAAIDLLGDMGVKDWKRHRQGAARSLAPDLIQVIHASKDAEVRAAAARALGKVNPDIAPPQRPTSEGVLATLTDLLQHGSVTERRAAADSLISLVKVLPQVKKEQGTALDLGLDADMLRLAQAVVPAAGRGLSDRDAEVRFTCAQAIQESAAAMVSEVRKRTVREDFPPEGLKLTEDMRTDMQGYAGDVKADATALRPLSVELGNQAKALANLTKDPDPRVRTEAYHALEEIGFCYRRLKRRADSVPKAAQPAKEEPSPLLDGLLAALPAMADGLSDPDVATRAAAIDALELLEDKAAPAIPALRRALHDPDRFVRWSAARTLGRMGADKATVAVPDLAQLAADPDLDVQKTAMGVLERFGPASKPALGALIKAAASSEGSVQIAAIHALEAIGPDARPAIPTLIAHLDAPDALVRQASAQALGRFGAAARDAVPALQGLLKDSDADVRQAATEALLNVAPPAGR